MEYAPSFLDFMASAQGKAEQQLGDSVIAAQAPDWRAVLTSGMALAAETRDLRVATILTHAATEVHGLRGLVDGLALILDWLSTHWEALHPVLTVDGEYDPLMRTNALSYLYAPHACLKAIRQARLLESHAGSLSVGEAENILKGRPVGDTALVSTPEQLSHLLAEASERHAQTFAALREASNLQQGIESLWKSHLEAEYWPDFGEFSALLARLSEWVTAPGAAALAQELSQENTEAVASPTAAVAALPSAVNNRRDAFHALALARQYFEQHETSHPAPLLIRRIEKLEHFSFAEIISELTPDGFGQLKQIAGGDPLQT